MKDRIRNTYLGSKKTAPNSHFKGDISDTNDCQLLTWDYLITAIALRIRESLDLPTILQTTADEVLQLLGCERVLLYQFAPDWSGQVVVESVSEPQFSLIDRVVPDLCFEEAWLEPFRQGQCSARTDIVDDQSLTPCHGEFLTKYQVRANLVCPILYQSQLWGFLIAHNCTTPRQWLLEEINGLQQIAVHVGITLYQASLLEQLQASKVSLEAQVASRTFDLAQLAAIVEHSQDAIISKTPNGIITSWNQAAENLLGYSPQDVIGQPISMLIPLERQIEELQILQAVHQGERVETYETQRLHQNGSLVDVELTVSPIRDENGNVIGASKILRDIRDRKQVELALQESEARFQHLVAHVPSIIYTVVHPQNAPPYFEYISSAVIDISEITPEQVYADPSLVFRQWHPEDMAAYEAASQLSLANLEPFSFEWRIITPSGKVKWLNIHASVERRQNGDLARYGVVEDVSDRKQAEIELKKMSERLDLSLRSGRIGCWDWDIKQNIILWDERMYELYGVTKQADSVNYDIWAKGVHPDDRTYAETLLQQAILRQAEYDIEFRVVHPDRSIHFIRAYGILVCDAQGNPNRMIGVNFDISDRKQVELALQQSEARFQHLVAHVPSIIYTIVHPVNAPPYFEYMSAAVVDIFEVSPEQVYADNSILFKQCHPEDLAAYEAMVRHCISTLDPFIFEWRIITPSGKLKWLDVNALVERRENGDVVGHGVVTDVSDRKQTELALQSSEAKYRHLINNLHAGFALHAADTSIILVNSKACDLLGLTLDQMLGKTAIDPAWHFFHEDGSVMLIEEYPVNKVLRTGLPLQNYVLGINRSDRTQVWVLVNAFPEFDINQQIQQVTITFIDISDRKQAEIKLKSVNQQLSDHIAELNQRHWEMMKLSEIGDFLQACLTVEEACKVLSHLIKPLFPNCSGSIFITRASRDRVEAMSSWGEKLHSEVDFLPNDCWGLRRGRVHFADQQSGPYCNHVLLNEAIDITLCIPMIAQGETIGLFYLSSNTATTLTEPKQQLAKTLAEQVGLAIANLRLQETLKQQSIRDPLTGLFNRRYLEERLNQELSRAQRQQHQISVIMIDIDHFKRFNDSYGHDAGDYVLQTVGSLLKSYVRGFDIACRYGGEEMILILPESSLEIASKRAEEIREAIAQITLSHNAQLLGSLTASFGVASFPQHGATSNAVMQAADAALYRAKAAGRNQVLIAL